MKTVSVVYYRSETEDFGGRMYDYLVHDSLGEVEVGEVFYAEARDTTAIVQVKALHVTPSKWANKFVFQRISGITTDGVPNQKVDLTLLKKIRTDRDEAGGQ